MKRTWSGSRRSGILVPDRRNPKAPARRAGSDEGRFAGLCAFGDGSAPDSRDRRLVNEGVGIMSEAIRSPATVCHPRTQPSHPGPHRVSQAGTHEDPEQARLRVAAVDS
jgi:hypothetical protein